MLLKFQRNPQSFLHALMNCNELMPLRENAEAHGQSTILASRAKIFVHPCNYDSVLIAIVQQKLHLFGAHVVVEQEFEDTLINMLKRIVKPKQGGRTIIDLTPFPDASSPQAVYNIRP